MPENKGRIKKTFKQISVGEKKTVNVEHTNLNPKNKRGKKINK